MRPSVPVVAARASRAVGIGVSASHVEAAFADAVPTSAIAATSTDTAELRIRFLPDGPAEYDQCAWKFKTPQDSNPASLEGERCTLAGLRPGDAATDRMDHDRT